MQKVDVELFENNVVWITNKSCHLIDNTKTKQLANQTIAPQEQNSYYVMKSKICQDSYQQQNSIIQWKTTSRYYFRVLCHGKPLNPYTLLISCQLKNPKYGMRDAATSSPEPHTCLSSSSILSWARGILQCGCFLREP